MCRTYAEGGWGPLARPSRHYAIRTLLISPDRISPWGEPDEEHTGGGKVKPMTHVGVV